MKCILDFRFFKLTRSQIVFNSHNVTEKSCLPAKHLKVIQIFHKYFQTENTTNARVSYIMLLRASMHRIQAGTDATMPRTFFLQKS